MTLGERVELKRQGIEVLRPLFDHRKSMWALAKCTIHGGWARYGTDWHATKTEAERHIDRIVAMYPKQYKKDD